MRRMQTSVPSQRQLISNRLKLSTWSNRDSMLVKWRRIKSKARIRSGQFGNYFNFMTKSFKTEFRSFQSFPRDSLQKWRATSYKKKIDDIALKMINETKKYEKNVFEQSPKRNEPSSFDETKSTWKLNRMK